jgi:hypothetical protein
MTKPFKVKTWNHILIEGFCMINTDYTLKSSKWTYGWKGNDDPAARGKRPNPQYDPTAVPDEKPEWCAGYVCPECLRDKGTMCEHLAYAPAEKKIQKKFKKMIRKMYGLDKK